MLLTLSVVILFRLYCCLVSRRWLYLSLNHSKLSYFLTPTSRCFILNLDKNKMQLTLTTVVKMACLELVSGTADCFEHTSRHAASYCILAPILGLSWYPHWLSTVRQAFRYTHQLLKLCVTIYCPFKVLINSFMKINAIRLRKILMFSKVSTLDS